MSFLRRAAPVALVCAVVSVAAAEEEISFEETFAATARSTGATWAHGRELLMTRAANHLAFVEAQRVSDDGPRRVLANALLIRLREPELLRRTRRLLTLPHTTAVAADGVVRLTATAARTEGETLSIEREALRWVLVDLLRERQGANLSWSRPMMECVTLCASPEIAHEAVVGLARSDVHEVLPGLGELVVPELVALLTAERVIDDAWRRAPAAAEVLARMGRDETAPQVAGALDCSEADDAIRLARALAEMDRDLARRHALAALTRADERHVPELYRVMIELGEVASVPIPEDPRARAHQAALVWELSHRDEVTELADLVLAEGIVVPHRGWHANQVEAEREAAWDGIWYVHGAERNALAGHLPDALLLQMAWVRDGEPEWAEVVRRGLPGHLELARAWLARHPNWSAEALLTALARRHGDAALPDLLAAAASREHARRLSAAAAVLHVDVAEAVRVLTTAAETQMTRSEADLPRLLLELAAHEAEPSDENDAAILARAESRDSHVRRLVVLHALRHARARHVELLARTFAASEDAQLRLAARDALVRIGASVLPAVAGIDSLDPSLLAALRLRVSRPDLVKAVGVALVKHRAYNPSIRGPQEHDFRLAGDNLAKEVGPEARPLLEEHLLLSSGQAGGVSETLFALAAIGELESVPPILRAVRRAGGIRYAAEALAEFGEEAQELLRGVPLPDPDRAGYRGRGARHVAAATATAPKAEQLLAGLAAPRPDDPTLAQQWLKRRKEYLGLAARSDDDRVRAAVDEIAAGDVSDHVEAVWEAMRARPREVRRAFLLRVVRNGWALHNAASLIEHAFGEPGVRVLLDLAAELGDPAGHRALDLAQEIAFAPYPETNAQTYAAERAEILPVLRNQFVSGAPARRRALAERLGGLYRVAPEAWIPDELTSWIEEGNEPPRSVLFALGAIGNERTARVLFAIYERNHERDIARALGRLGYAPAADLLEQRVWHWIETRPGYWTDMYELVALAELEEWERVWRVYREAEPMRTRLQAAELLAEAGDERLFEPLAAQIDELIDRSDAALARASVSEEKHTLLQRWKNTEAEWLRRAIAALLTLNQEQALDHLRPRLLRVEAVELRQLLERALPTAQYGDR